MWSTLQKSPKIVQTYLGIVFLWGWPNKVVVAWCLDWLCNVNSRLRRWRSSDSLHWNATLAHLSCNCRRVVRGDLCPEGARVSLENVGYSFSSNYFVVAIVFTVAAVAIGATILSASEAFAIELEALAVLARAAFALTGDLKASTSWKDLAVKRWRSDMSIGLQWGVKASLWYTNTFNDLWLRVCRALIDRVNSSEAYTSLVYCWVELMSSIWMCAMVLQLHRKSLALRWCLLVDVERWARRLWTWLHLRVLVNQAHHFSCSSRCLIFIDRHMLRCFTSCSSTDCCSCVFSQPCLRDTLSLDNIIAFKINLLLSFFIFPAGRRFDRLFNTFDPTDVRIYFFHKIKSENAKL